MYNFLNINIDECPICMRKLYLAIGFNMLDRYKAILSICGIFGGYFIGDADWYKLRIADMGKKPLKKSPK